MCGIAGIISKKGNLPDLLSILQKMSGSLSHRGPDDEGIVAFTENNYQCFKTENSNKELSYRVNYLPKQYLDISMTVFAGFAHRRLSIIDLSELGHQPMCTADEKLWISFNGEIYNYLELKSELKLLGYQFISATDTEVLLYAYREWGTRCVEKFNGMWAFCIFDREKQLFFASRDRLGVKPFYYINNIDVFAFASEQKAFIKGNLVTAQMNEKALHHYLVNEELESEPTNFFEGVIELMPGSQFVYHLHNTQLDLETYFSPNHLITQHNVSLLDEDLISQIKSKLYSAVRYRLRSDVEVGTCLSGGIDSSALLGIMAGETNKPVNAFTAVYKKGAGNEGPFAEKVAQMHQAKHCFVEPNLNDFKREFETLIYALDAPIWDSSTFSQFKVMELAANNGIQVVLDGQGADELFTGYHHHYLALWRQIKLEDGLWSAINEARASSETIPSPLMFWLKQELKHNLLKQKFPYFKDDFTNLYPVKPAITIRNNVNLQLLDDLGYKRLKSFLRCEDRCSMWHSVESRTPFSDDIELMKLMFSFNGKRKIKNGVSKYYLREAAKEVLPKEIYQRKDKIGFETPMNYWLSEMAGEVFQMIDPKSCSFLNTEKFKNEYRSDNLKHNKLLLKLFTLITWQKVFSS